MSTSSYTLMELLKDKLRLTSNNSVNGKSALMQIKSRLFLNSILKFTNKLERTLKPRKTLRKPEKKSQRKLSERLMLKRKFTLILKEENGKSIESPL